MSLVCELLNVVLVPCGQVLVACFVAKEFEEDDSRQRDESPLVHQQGVLHVAVQFEGEGEAHSLSQEEGKHFDDGVRVLLLQSEQIVEVNESVLLEQVSAHFVNELFRETYLVEVVEEDAHQDPEEVDNDVAQA